MLKDLWEKNKGKFTIAFLAIIIGAGGSFAGVSVTSNDDGQVCVGITPDNVE